MKNFIRCLYGVCAVIGILFFCGCHTTKPDLSNHYPTGFEGQCQEANNWGYQQVKNILKKEPVKFCGWTVRIIKHNYVYNGQNCFKQQNGELWGAWTQAAITYTCKQPNGSVRQGDLMHEARHYWAYMNKVDVGRANLNDEVYYTPVEK